MALISKPINLSTEANLLYEIYKTLKKINIASGSSSIPFEIQIKQTTIDDPLIILSGSIQGNRGATITPSLASPGSNGIYRLTASTDIFKDLKDCYKRTDYYDVNILQYGVALPFVFTWFWYYIDDYTLEVVVTDGLAGSPAAELLTDYVLLKAEYKN